LTSAGTHDEVDHLFRHRAGQMVATLTRIFGFEHLDAIQEAVQDAFVQALRRWPFEGTPHNPSAWLIQVAKNRLLDRLRRSQRWERKRGEIEQALGASTAGLGSGQPGFADELRDDTLGMIFACCHPGLPRPGQVALTLRVVGGFSLSEIARAFLAREEAIAQRLRRARQRLRELGVRPGMPPPEELGPRLDAALAVPYLMFNEGYSALSGDELVRADLCHEAIRLVELLAAHPRVGAPRVHALAALLLFQASRLPARCGADQELLLLEDQDRTRWDRRLIARGLEHFRRSAGGTELSAYHLEAEIASCHALAPSPGETDWGRVLSAYDALLERQPSPVVALNRAIAVAHLRGPEAGLEEIEELRHVRVLRHYHPLHATRGELLRRVGRHREAVDAFREAQALTSSEPVRRFLARRIHDASLSNSEQTHPSH